MAVVTTKTTLLVSRRVSRDKGSNLFSLIARGALRANKVRDPPTTTAIKTNMKTPLVGSLANAWTDVSTPERTKKVPSRLRPNADIASSKLQLVKFSLGQ